MAASTMSAIAPVAPVAAPVANRVSAKNMMTWNPIGNTMFETFSFLPPLSESEIARQVDYIIQNGWTPCLEISPAETSSTKDVFAARIKCSASTYYDNRYWSLWKLPMFGCTNADEVLREIMAAKRAFPDCYVRVAAFDADKQVQTCSFLVQRIAASLPLEKRSLA
eukprot:scaffold661548_cov61-Prasinocladus_malaysianus.AAC.1